MGTETNSDVSILVIVTSLIIIINLLLKNTLFELIKLRVVKKSLFLLVYIDFEYFLTLV